MDFFQHQDAARRRTGRLVGLFIVAVLATIIVTYILVAGALAFVDVGQGDDAGQRIGPPPSLVERIWRPELLALVGVGTVVLVAGGSLYKINQLSGGGHTIANALGGRIISYDTVDLNERKVLNVVEEMAIASGTPVPPVYLLDREQGINAFAAGYSPDDAVIGVTRGCIDALSRDELQGVIAHEFSHILNGDMRINIRMIGIIFGIILIGLAGRFVIRSLWFSGSSRRSRSSNKDSGGAAIIAIMLVGFGLMIIGFVGSLFGSFIKAAVSRQREYLADASAVQFTRNPHGIAGALKKIGGWSAGSTVESPGASEVSHMFFATGVSSFFDEMMATHPPLVKRIQRIDPSFDGEFPTTRIERPGRGAAAAAIGLAGAGQANRAPSAVDERPAGVSTESYADRIRQAREAAARPPAVPTQAVERAQPKAIAAIGRATDAHLEYARSLIDSIPPGIRGAAGHPFGARAVIYSILIDKDPTVRRAQLDCLARDADRPVFQQTQILLPLLNELDERALLPLVDLTIPALRSMTRPQYLKFLIILDELVKANHKIELFEWTLHRIIKRHVAPTYQKVKPQAIEYFAVGEVDESAGVIISTLAHVGHADRKSATHAHALAMESLKLSNREILPRDQCGLGALDRALSQLDRASGEVKAKVLRAAAMAIAADHEVTVMEADLFRAMCDAMGCPMPPLLPGQPLV